MRIIAFHDCLTETIQEARTGRLRGSESQFKTFKYRPDFPGRFGSLEDGRVYCRAFFRWYNQEHYHSGIALLTPHQVHYRIAYRILDARHEALLSAYAAHPSASSKGHRGDLHCPPRSGSTSPRPWRSSRENTESAGCGEAGGR